MARTWSAVLARAKEDLAARIAAEVKRQGLPRSPVHSIKRKEFRRG